MNNKFTSNCSIRKFRNNNFHSTSDIVCREKHYSLFYNNKKIITLRCLDENVEELAVGYLIGHGIVNKEFLLHSIKVNNEDIEISGEQILKTSVNSISKMARSTNEAISILPSQILKIMNEFIHRSDLFKSTGGVHSGGLATVSDILFYTEDISRHNVLDKVIGYQVLKQINTTPIYYITTGRINSEIMDKIVDTNLSGIISHSAVTDKAIEIAHNFGIQLFGFVRDRGFNQY